MSQASLPSASGNEDSVLPILSAAGDLVLVASAATDLVSTGTIAAVSARAPMNVYVRDRARQETRLVSKTPEGGTADGDCWPAGVSADGRYALFESAATNLLEGDANDAMDLFVADLTLNTIELVSATTQGKPGNARSFDGQLTPDGRVVVFASDAGDLVPGDTNRASDIFVRDLATRQTRRLSSTDGTRSLARSCSPRVTPNGRLVAFLSTGMGTSRTAGMYVADVMNQTWMLVSAAASNILRQITGLPNAPEFFAHAMSDDGAYVFYGVSSGASERGVILRAHVPSGQTETIHTNAVAAREGQGSNPLHLSADGQHLAFVAYADEFGAPGTQCVLRWDAESGATTLVSVNDPGRLRPGTVCAVAGLSRDGGTVAFVTDSVPWTNGPSLEGFHLYIRDPAGQGAILVDEPTSLRGMALDPVPVASFSSNFSVVAFCSPTDYPQILDRNRRYDVFARGIAEGTLELVSAAVRPAPSFSANGSSSMLSTLANISGRYVVFASYADNLVENDANGFVDIFRCDLHTGSIELISASTNGSAADGESLDPTISEDGRYVAFASRAVNLAPGATNGSWSVFVRDTLAGRTVLVDTQALYSVQPRIGSDGRFLLYRRSVQGSVAEVSAIFDRQSGAISQFAGSGTAAMAPTGKYVAYMVPPQVALWDCAAAAEVGRIYLSPTRLLALSPNGRFLAYDRNGALGCLDWQDNTAWTVLSNKCPREVRFSADSVFLAFETVAPFDQADANSYVDIYSYGLQSRTLSLVSRSSQPGTAADGASSSPVISADSRFIAYRSTASNLVADDTNGCADIFLHDRLGRSTYLLSPNAATAGTQSGRSFDLVFTLDSKSLLFASSAAATTLGDHNRWADLFAFDIFASGAIPLFAVRTHPPGAGQGITLIWQVIAGATYQVEYKESLYAPTWTPAPVSPIYQGSQAFFTDPEPAAAAARFYRITAVLAQP